VSDSVRIARLIRDLYRIVAELEEIAPGRRFTPDGHLVGTIGEVVAAERFGLKLMPASTEGYDAIAPDGRTVEIKATQRTSVAIQADVKVPDHLIVMKIEPDGAVNVVYNSHAAPAWDLAGAPQKNGQRRISLAKLEALMADMPSSARLKEL
jgi:hypothetical protein